MTDTDAGTRVFIFRTATLSVVVDRYRQAWEAERKARDRDVAMTIESGARLVDHYWQAEYRARLLLRTALDLAEALQSDRGDAG